MLNQEQIKDIIPHREPFLLVDQVVKLEPGKCIKALKKIRGDEYFFKGHFPSNPIMPGVLIVEAMAQAGAIALLTLEEHKGKLALFAGIEKVRFKQLVKPGDILTMEVELLNLRRTIGRAKAEARVAGKLACSGEIMFAIV